ncbi:MAG: hypothetical protein ACSHX4_12500 [Opitutaceae bacterium]
MKTRLPVILFAVLGLVSVASVLSARASQSEHQNAIEFSCVIWEPLSLPQLFYRQGAEFYPLELAPGRRSSINALKDTSALELHIRRETFGGQSDYELVGLAPCLDGSERMLFLIEEVEDAHGLPLQIRGLDDSLKAFPPGAFRFVNETPDLLTIVFGEASISLAADSVEVVNSGVDPSGGFLPILIKDDQENVISETRLFSQASARQIVFIHPPKKIGGRLSMVFLSELLPSSSR